jgi:hypothetical protein
MPLIVYLDEAGDHSMESIDRDFPVFVLVMLVCDTEVYTRPIVPEVYRLKLDYWGHEGVILHSRDIRKAQGAFGFLTAPAARPPFYERINRLMRDSDYQLLCAAIHKQRHRDRYGDRAHNPYDLALTFTLERLLPLLEDAGQTEVQIVAEARGKNEDDELRLSFLRTVTNGTRYVAAERFRRIRFDLRFLPKLMNIVGTQMADLAAYPLARHVLDPSQPSLAFEVVEPKLCRRRGSRTGLKVFP